MSKDVKILWRNSSLRLRWHLQINAAQVMHIQRSR
jgi:hypothetical protein